MQKSISIALHLCLLGVFLSSNIQSQTDFQPYSIDWKTGNSTAFDLSYLLEKPAGSAGFVEIRDGHFFTADGKRLRIWGVNMTGGAGYPEKKDAAIVAAFLARYGINAARFHFLDSNWGPDKSIFDYTANTTGKFNPQQLDKLDFFIAELKKQGIYTNINLNVGRNFKAGDGARETEYLGLAKGATLFDDLLIKLQKDYARQLLTHENPYTGNRYVDEPALVIVEIVNENSLVEAWFSDRLNGKSHSSNPSTWSGAPPYYANVLTEKYNLWLNENISDEQIIEIDKEAGRDPEGRIPRLESEEFEQASALRFQTEASFIIETERNYYSGMHQYLKSTLGVKAHIIGNSDHNHYKSGYALLSSLSKLDAVDGHVYWQHPKYVRDPETGSNRITFKHSPMVNEPGISTVVQLSRSAVQGKPYTVSETNHPFPNAYACEGIPILAAYGLLQDWDGVFYYTLEHDDPSSWNTKTPNPFDIYSDPVKMAQMAAGALMFHHADVQKADSVVLRNYAREEILDGIRSDFGEMPFFTPGFNSILPLIYGTRIEGFFQEHTGYKAFDTPNPIISQTGQLKWYHGNSKGMVQINTPQTQGLIGFVNGTRADLPHLELETQNEFCAVMLNSMEHKAIVNAERIMLSATAKYGLTGMTYNQSHTELTEWGKKPGLIEIVSGTVRIQGLNNVKSVELIPIDGDGTRIGAERIKPDKDGTVKLEIGNHVTTLYLLEINR